MSKEVTKVNELNVGDKVIIYWKHSGHNTEKKNEMIAYEVVEDIEDSYGPLFLKEIDSDKTAFKANIETLKDLLNDIKAWPHVEYFAIIPEGDKK